MEEQSKKIWEILRSHKGKRKAITAKDISEKSDLSEREVRRVISLLVRKEKALIVSSVHDPYGFYIVKNLKELMECHKQYCSRIKALKERDSILYKNGMKKIAKKRQGRVQIQ